MDDDDRPSRHSLNDPLTRQYNSGATYSSYSTDFHRDPLLYSTALDRDLELYSKRNSPRTSQSKYRDPLLYSTALDRDPELYSKRNSPQTSQSNSGVTNSSFKTCNDSYPTQNKSTYDLNRITVVKNSAPVQLSRDETAKSRARDAVSGNDTLKLPYIPKSLGSVFLSGNRTATSIISESPKSFPSFQPLKPPPISTQPTIAVASSKKSTYDLNRATVVKNSAPVQLSRDDAAYKSRARDAGNDTLKGLSLSDAILSGNVTFTSIKSESPKSSPSFQPLKPPPISTQPTIAVASSKKSTYDLNRATVVKNSAPVQLSRDDAASKSRARDAGNDTLKGLSLSDAILSGNVTFTSIKSESPKSSPSFQPLKPPPISTQPTIAVASSKKSTYDLNRATVVKNSAPVQLSRDDAASKSRARDAGNDTLKGLSLSDAILSGNMTFTSIKSESPKSSPSFQPLKPPPISTQPTIAVASSKKSTYDLNRATVVKNSAPVQLSRDETAKSRARDAVSGNDTLKLPYIPKSLGSVFLSGNRTATSVISESPKSFPSFQPLKPPPISTQPTIAVASSKKSTYDLNRATVVKNSASVQLSRDDAAYKLRARDAVSGNDTLKLPYIPKSLGSVILFGNRTFNSIKSESPKSSPSFQPLKPPPISTKPTIAVASSSSSIPQSTGVQLSRDDAAYKSRARDAVSGNDTLKLPYNPKSLGYAILSGNRTVTSIKSESPKSSLSFQPLKPPPISTQPTIAVASSSSSIPQSKDAYVWVEQASTTYVFPKEIKSLIEKDTVPGVLKMPLSKSSYKDYFHALLYAEDCYLEKWDGFEMKNVKVELHEATIYTRRGNNRNLKYEDNDDKFFVAFELDKIHERRPFLISRDFVSLQPTKQTIKPLQGVIYRVVKSNLVLAEFGQEFFSRHHPDDEYDVKFSFNRVCLKRAHQAIAAASESQLDNLLFPSIPPKHELPSSQRYIHQKKPLAVGHILRLEGLPPYLVEGPLAVERDKLSYLVRGPLAVERYKLSKTGEVVVEAIIQIIRADPSKKILLCAPMNRTCDVLMRGLKKEIDESEMFRANAAFREVDGVPEDILSSCLYEDDKEYFSCPEFTKLKEYKGYFNNFHEQLQALW